MKNNKKGFTLIELLVVIAIIGLLSTLAVVSLNNARTKSRDARRQSDLKQISTAMELYMSQTDEYPTNNTAGCTAGTPGQVAGDEGGGVLETLCGGAGMSICSNGNAATGDTDCEDTADGTDSVYLQAIPTDPTTGQVYSYEGDATSYCLSATLEGTAGTFFVCMNGSCYVTTTNCAAI